MYTHCMPSQTVYVSDSVYDYAKETADDGQTVGKRLQELIEQGIEFEERGSDVL